MEQLPKNRLVTRYVLVLFTAALLIGSTIGCSQRGAATQSGQATNQPPSQSTSQPGNNEPIFTVVEVPPSFPGGNAQLDDYLRKNLRYPQAAIKARAEGRVFVTFLVTKEGNIQDVSVLKGYGHGISEEAIRLVQAMPNWTPGRQSGRPVHVKYNLVVPFELASLK